MSLYFFHAYYYFISIDPTLHKTPNWKKWPHGVMSSVTSVDKVWAHHGQSNDPGNFRQDSRKVSPLREWPTDVKSQGEWQRVQIILENDSVDVLWQTRGCRICCKLQCIKNLPPYNLPVIDGCWTDRWHRYRSDHILQKWHGILQKWLCKISHASIIKYAYYIS